MHCSLKQALLLVHCTHHLSNICITLIVRKFIFRKSTHSTLHFQSHLLLLSFSKTFLEWFYVLHNHYFVSHSKMSCFQENFRDEAHKIQWCNFVCRYVNILRLSVVQLITTIWISVQSPLDWMFSQRFFSLPFRLLTLMENETFLFCLVCVWESI